LIKPLAYLLPVTLIACAPVPMTLERAERICREDAGLADGFAGNVGVGIGTGGAKARGSITVTNKILNPQSEPDFMRECVMRVLNGERRPATFGITVGAS
jgi:hypothetical protein